MRYGCVLLMCGFGIVAFGENASFIPNGECTCLQQLVLVNPGTQVQFQCAAYRMGPAELMLAGENQVSEVDELSCNNCAEPCNAMHCVQSLCVTKTDSGSVSGTGGFSVALKSEINTVLAGAVEIETTAEFTVGYTSTTEISSEYCVECGADSIQPCTGTVYRLYSYRAERDARVPLGHLWYVRIKRPGEDWTEWQVDNGCAGVAGYATIDGFKGSAAGCVATPIHCGLCEVCHPR